MKIPSVASVAALAAIAAFAVSAPPPGVFAQTTAASGIQIQGGARGGATVIPGPGAPGAQQAPPLTWTGVIVGRVVDVSSGKGVPGAIVMVNGGMSYAAATAARGSLPPESPPRYMTDSEGRFAFTGLSRGTYTVTVQKAGYTTNYAPARAGGIGRPIILGDDQRVGDVVVRVAKYASVSGSIVDEAGEPVVGMNVRAYRRTLTGGSRVLQAANMLGTGGTATTDDRGEYRLANLQPGEYVVVVPMMVQSVPSDFMSNGRGDPNLSATMTMPNVGGGGSWGRGDTPGSADGRFLLRSTSNGSSTPTFIREATGRILSYPTQYYPGAPTSTEAQTISLASGDDRAGVNFTLRLTTTAAVSGQLEGPDGPAVNYILHLAPSVTGEMSGEPDIGQAITDSTGSFMFLGVTPGQYVLQTVRQPRNGQMASPMPVAAVGGGGSFGINAIGAPPVVPQEPLLWLAQPVSVGAADVLGLGLRLQTGLTISGRVEFDGAAQRPASDRLRSIPILIEAAGQSFSPGSQPMVIQPDLRFSSNPLVPGQYLVRIGGQPPGWTTRSAMYEGRDLVDIPITLTKSIDGVVITFTDRPSDLRCTVRLPPDVTDGAAVLAFPTDAALWTGTGTNPRRLRASRVLNASSPATLPLPPGEYYVIAIRDEQSSEWQDPKFLEALARRATRVTISDGQHATVDLDLQDVRRTMASANAGRMVLPSAILEEPREQPPTHGPFVPDEPQQPRDTPPVTVGKATLSGTVLSASGDAPIRRARVVVANADFRERSTWTDDNGRWAFDDLPAGDYSMTAQKAAYLTAVYGAKTVGPRTTIGPQVRVHAEPGKPAQNLVLRMTRGSVVSGRALDQFGQPLANAIVALSQFVMQNGERVLRQAQFSGGRQTDDRGMFRLYGVAPGSYVVSVTPQDNGLTDIRLLSESEMRAAIAAVSQRPATAPGASGLPSLPLGQGPGGAMNMPANATRPPASAPVPPPPASGQSVGFTATYYPGTVTLQEATTIAVGIGQELTGIDVAVRLVRTARIDGAVLGMDGRSTRANVVLQTSVNGNGFRSLGIRMSEDGHFSATGIAPGHYQLVASASTPGAPVPPGGVPQPQTLTQYARQDFDVSGENITGLELRLMDAMTITGQLAFDGRTRQAPGDLAGLSIMLQAAPGVFVNGPTARTTTIDANGTFVLKGVIPGRFRLVASLPSRPGDSWTLKSAVMNGVETVDGWADIPAGLPPADARIVMTDQISDLHGRLVDGTGAGVGGIFAADNSIGGLFVTVFPADRALWTISRRTRLVTADQNGRYTTQLPPGDYLFAVLSEVDLESWNDPATLEQIAAAAVKITIAEGEKKQFDVRVK